VHQRNRCCHCLAGAYDTIPKRMFTELVLRVPPGNRLEALRGDRVGQHSVRINDQWRICFIWREGDAYDVQIIDDH
jgi:plasmid maintenance system killer protein